LNEIIVLINGTLIGLFIRLNFYTFIIYITAGFIMHNLGKYDDARSYFEKALKINPNLTSILSEKKLTAFNKLMNNSNTKQ
jgi:tetratricopeptide (TPR) repeat protein